MSYGACYSCGASNFDTKLWTIQQYTLHDTVMFGVISSEFLYLIEKTQLRRLILIGWD